MAVDEIDKKILRCLVVDSQQPLTVLSETIGLSTTALHHRIKNLQKKKIIQRFTISLSEEFFESDISCFVRVIKFKKSSVDLAKKLKLISGVESCYSVTGEESLLLKIRAKSTKELQELLEVINKTEGIERTLTNLIIEEHFNKGAVIL